MTIQLIQVEAAKTKCMFEIFNTIGSQIQPATLTEMLDTYLLTFTNLLTGKTKIVEKTSEQIAAENAKRTRNLIIIIAIVVVTIVLLFYSKMR